MLEKLSNYEIALLQACCRRPLVVHSSHMMKLPKAAGAVAPPLAPHGFPTSRGGGPLCFCQVMQRQRVLHPRRLERLCTCLARGAGAAGLAAAALAGEGEVPGGAHLLA